MFFIFFQEEGEAEVGGHAKFSRIVSKKVIEKIEKDRRKLWMICFCFHLCFFSWLDFVPDGVLELLISCQIAD